jgi:hypothetical protein
MLVRRLEVSFASNFAIVTAFAHVVKKSFQATAGAKDDVTFHTVIDRHYSFRAGYMVAVLLLS